MKRQRLTITLRENVLKKIDSEIDGQKIRNRSHAIETFLMERFQTNIIKKVIILGGGKKITIKNKMMSKLLLPVGNQTLIGRNIEILKNYGVTDLILSVGGFGDQIRKVLKDGSKFKIKILYFERDRGTASILHQAKTLLDNTFLISSGDVLLEDIDINDVYQFHKNNKGLGTILLTTTSDPRGLGSITMKGNQIIKFVEKPTEVENNSCLVSTGIYLLEPEVCDMISADSFSLEYDVFPELVRRGKLFGYSLDSKWIHLHDEEKYNEYLKTVKKTKL